MLKTLLAGTLALTAIVAGQPASAQGGQCFLVTQWEGWKAPNDHTILISVRPHQIYRLDLAGGCPELTWPGARLISRDRVGAGSICSPLDFDLKVSIEGSGATACIVNRMTLLSPDEAARIPPHLRP
ncbi:MAG TPA: DUF6491 family protein [Caulobacteraceae bacterium]|nr:DUF6491 family protein [Caulobacteraceae bacterium]